MKKTVKAEKFKQLEVWKTIKVDGRYKSLPDLKRAVLEGGSRVGNFVVETEGHISEVLRDEYRKTEDAGVEEDIFELVLVMPAEIGFNNEAKVCLKDFYRQVLKCGLGLCSARLGMQFRAQYKDQPKGEKLFMGMYPLIIDDYRYEHDTRLPAKLYTIFEVVHGDDGRMINGVDCHPDDRSIDSTSSWVFVHLPSGKK